MFTLASLHHFATEWPNKIAYIVEGRLEQKLIYISYAAPNRYRPVITWPPENIQVPISVLLMGASNLAARAYANPQAAGRLLTAAGRGATTSQPRKDKEYYQRQMAEIMRGGQ